MNMRKSLALLCWLLLSPSAWAATGGFGGPGAFGGLNINLPVVPSDGTSCPPGTQRVIAVPSGGCISTTPGNEEVNWKPGVPKIGDQVNRVNVPSDSGANVHIPMPGGSGVPPKDWKQDANGNAIPPDTAPAILKYFALGTFYDDQTVACQKLYLPPTFTDVSAGPDSTCKFTYHGSPKTDPLVSVLGCPSGYSKINNICTLTDATKVPKPKDGHCNVLVKGSSFSGDPNDPDCLLSPDVKQNPDNATKSGPDGKTEVKRNADGSTTITYSEYNYTDNTTTTTTVVINGAGQVTGTKTETSKGTGDLNDPNKPADPGVGDKTKIDLPTDYAKAGEADAAADKIKAGQCGGPNQPPCKIDGSDFKTPDSKSASDKALDAYKGVSDDIKKIPDSTPIDSPALNIDFWNPTELKPGECQPLSWTALNHTVTYDICPHVSEIRTIFSYVLYLLTIGLIFGIFTSVGRV